MLIFFLIVEASSSPAESSNKLPTHVKDFKNNLPEWALDYLKSKVAKHNKEYGKYLGKTTLEKELQDNIKRVYFNKEAYDCKYTGYCNGWFQVPSKDKPNYALLSDGTITLYTEIRSVVKSKEDKALNLPENKRDYIGLGVWIFHKDAEQFLKKTKQ